MVGKQIINIFVILMCLTSVSYAGDISVPYWRPVEDEYLFQLYPEECKQLEAEIIKRVKSRKSETTLGLRNIQHEIEKLLYLSFYLKLMEDLQCQNIPDMTRKILK